MSRLRLGIAAALAAEARCLWRRPARIGEVQALPDGVLLCVSGIGPDAASRAGARLLAAGAGALLSWGTAAALAPAMQAGDLLLPVQVQTAHSGAITVSPPWHRGLQQRLSRRFHTLTEPLTEATAVLCTSADKQALHAQTGAAAADMESAALGIMAQQARIPFAVVRVVADGAATAVPAWLAADIDAAGGLRLISLLGACLGHPGDWPALLALARSFHTAQATLKGVARYAGLRYLAPPPASGSDVRSGSV